MWKKTTIDVKVILLENWIREIEDSNAKTQKEIFFLNAKSVGWLSTMMSKRTKLDIKLYLC